MGYLTKYGSFWGMIPQTSGRIFWVAPSASYVVEGRTYSASDNNDGLSPERAVLTLNRCFDSGYVTASVGDVVVLLPGSHSWSATQTIDVAGVTITGIPSTVPLKQDRMNGGSVRQRTQVATSAATTAAITVTAADVEIAYLHFAPVAGGSGVSASNAADRLYVHDCTFAMTTAANTATFGVEFPLGTGTAVSNDDSVIRNCYFYVTDNQGPAVRAAGTVTGLTIEQSTITLAGATAWDDAVEVTLAGSTGVTVRDVDFIQAAAGTVITDCIEVTGVTTDGATTVYRCYAPVGSDLVQASNTADAQCAECYLASQTGAITGSV